MKFLEVQRKLGVLPTQYFLASLVPDNPDEYVVTLIKNWLLIQSGFKHVQVNILFILPSGIASWSMPSKSWSFGDSWNGCRQIFLRSNNFTEWVFNFFPTLQTISENWWVETHFFSFLLINFPKKLYRLQKLFNK